MTELETAPSRQRLRIEEAGGPWVYVYCLFRVWRGNYHMDIERRVIAAKDFSFWREAFNAEARYLKAGPDRYDRAEFSAICIA